MCTLYLTCLCSIAIPIRKLVPFQFEGYAFDPLCMFIPKSCTNNVHVVKLQPPNRRTYICTRNATKACKSLEHRMSHYSCIKNPIRAKFVSNFEQHDRSEGDVRMLVCETGLGLVLFYDNLQSTLFGKCRRSNYATKGQEYCCYLFHTVHTFSHHKLLLASAEEASQCGMRYLNLKSPTTRAVPAAACIVLRLACRFIHPVIIYATLSKCIRPSRMLSTSAEKAGSRVDAVGACGCARRLAYRLAMLTRWCKSCRTFVGKPLLCRKRRRWSRRSRPWGSRRGFAGA